MKRILLIAILVVVIAGGWYAYTLYTGKVPSLTEVKTDARVSAVELIAAFEKDTAAANKTYLGKIVSINGTIKAVEEDGATIVLGDPGSSSSVRCSMDSSFVKTTASLGLGSNISVKGACTGFMPDETGLGLGSDVVLNRCVLEKEK